ncbi:hypothetical protein [uncultured Sphingomonas sp.]|uniref:hypothetical protein n=1 Tax=uncultured Sphingomonas sp. TaxID=158754 RepID=UPI0025F4D1AD|nr:hypothetical protein [uncultured Sphingomonas sp.]
MGIGIALSMLPGSALAQMADDQTTNADDIVVTATRTEIAPRRTGGDHRDRQ